MVSNVKQKAMALKVNGRICGSSSREFEAAARHWSRMAGSRKVVIDLSSARFVDDLGVNALERVGQLENVVLCNVSEKARRMLTMARPDAGCNFFRSIEEAEEKLNLDISSSPDSRSERRYHQRADIHAATKFRIASGKKFIAFKGVATNISVAGVLVEYPNDYFSSGTFALSLGLPVERIELFSLKSGLTLNGTLARLSTDHCQMGFGIAFSGLSDSERAHIATYVRKNYHTNLTVTGTEHHHRLNRL